MGLASGFLEPLESTSIHIIQSAIARLMTNFPDKAFNQHDIDYYNRRTRLEFEQIRDFLVLHYKATERDDTPFWDYVRTMEIPPSLAERIAIYKENGRLYRHDNELFSEASWLAVMHGQRIAAERHHPIADIISDEELKYRMNRIAEVLKNTVARMPTHQTFIDRHCKANLMKA
jgi:tryptophan halogenase